MPRTTTLHSCGTLISIPPKKANVSTTAWPLEIEACRRSSSQPPMIAVIDPPWKSCETHFRFTPPRSAKPFTVLPVSAPLVAILPAAAEPSPEAIASFRRRRRLPRKGPVIARQTIMIPRTTRRSGQTSPKV